MPKRRPLWLKLTLAGALLTGALASAGAIPAVVSAVATAAAGAAAIFEDDDAPPPAPPATSTRRRDAGDVDQVEDVEQPR